jgi:Sigma-70 region 2
MAGAAEGRSVRRGLVERARDGDDVAFAELVDLDGDRCYAIAYRILRDVERAQDAVQQAFLLAWRELQRLRDPDRFETARRPSGDRSVRWCDCSPKSGS